MELWKYLIVYRFVSILDFELPHKSWLTSIDEGCTHQGSWGRVGDVPGTAMSKTQVTAQNRGPGHTHREGYLTQLGSPANAYACGCVLANADKDKIKP